MQVDNTTPVTITSKVTCCAAGDLCTAPIGTKISLLHCHLCTKQMHSIEQCSVQLDLTDSPLIISSLFKKNSFTSEDTKQFILCFECQRELPNDLQNIVGSSEAEQIMSQTPLKNIVGTKELKKVSNENKSNDDTTVNNSVAANESSNVIRPVAGIMVTTNAVISTDAGTEELEKVKYKNKSKDDTTVNNPVAANESSNVIRPAADFTVTTNAVISTDAATTASATMLTTVAAPTTAGAAALHSKLCAAGATWTHSQGPADLSGSIFESITDAVTITANNGNGEKVDGKDGNGINDQ